MRSRLSVLALLASLTFGSSLAASTPLPLTATEPIPSADPSLEAALLDATNAARSRFGEPALTPDEGLARAARAHAAEMARLDYFSHGSPVSAHSTLEKRLALAGSPLADVAENLVLLGESAGDEADAANAVEDWLGSPHHRENLLNGHYDRVGFGAARDPQGRLFIVQDFGAEPVRLLYADVTRAERAVSELDVHVRSSRALTALFNVSGALQSTQALPAGDSTAALTTDANGSVQLVVGVQTGRNSYVIDDGGTVDLATGSYRAETGQPHAALTITGVDVHRRSDRGVRLTLAYAAPASSRLDLFLQGKSEPAARTSPGHFELFLPDTLGIATVSVGVDRGGGTVALVHRFHLDPSAAAPKLLAGPAPQR